MERSLNHGMNNTSKSKVIGIARPVIWQRTLINLYSSVTDANVCERYVLSILTKMGGGYKT